VVEHPQAAQGVFHKIADNPVRSEKLGCCRDIFLADLDILLQVGKDFFLLWSNVVLVDPAYYFNFVPVLFRND
jgi:hypothetical protein